jgi:GTP-binding protein
MRKLRVEFLKACAGPDDLPDRNVPEVALAGRSNVGKSSLLNALSVERKPARTSGRPGCTQTLNLYSVDGGRFHLVDLPGYGFARAPKKARRAWTEWIERYLMYRIDLRGIILLVDARHPTMNSDIDLARFLSELGRPYVVALTKADKLRGSKLRKSIELAEEMGPVLPVSALKRTGLDDLLRWVDQAVAV